MSVLCKIGIHSWSGCRCTRCYTSRDEKHDWSADCELCVKCQEHRRDSHIWDGCKCSRCGKIRDEGHTWNGCKCSKCGNTRLEGHSWNDDCAECSKCGMTRDERHHKWSGCTCSKCGRKRDRDHIWKGNECAKCGEIKCSECGRTHESILRGLGGIMVFGQLVAKCHKCGTSFCTRCAPYEYWTFYGYPEKISTCPICRVPIPEDGWDGGPPGVS